MCMYVCMYVYIYIYISARAFLKKFGYIRRSSSKFLDRSVRSFFGYRRRSSSEVHIYMPRGGSCRMHDKKKVIHLCFVLLKLRAGFFRTAGFFGAGFFLIWSWQWHKQRRSVHKVCEPALSSMAGFFRTTIASTTSLGFHSSSWYC